MGPGPCVALDGRPSSPSARQRRHGRQGRKPVTHILADITVTPDFVGLPPSLYHGLIHLTDNAAAVLTLVAGLGLTVSLIGLVLATFTSNPQMAERAKGGIAVSIFSVALLYIGVAAANYAGHLFQ